MLNSTSSPVNLSIPSMHIHTMYSILKLLFSNWYKLYHGSMGCWTSFRFSLFTLFMLYHESRTITQVTRDITQLLDSDYLLLAKQTSRHKTFNTSAFPKIFNDCSGPLQFRTWWFHWCRHPRWTNHHMQHEAKNSRMKVCFWWGAFTGSWQAD
jgi:hypothetical protein